MNTKYKDRREKAWYVNQSAIIAPFIAEAKKAGYKVSDGVETIILTRLDIHFKIMISRTSSVLQCYYTGAGWDFTSNSLSDFPTTEAIWSHVQNAIDTLSTEQKYLLGNPFGNEF